MVDNYILRKNARSQLGGSPFTTTWLLMLLVCAIPVGASLLCGSIPAVGTIALFVVSGAISYGVARVTLRCVRGEKWALGQVFCAFTESGFVKTILLYLLHSVFITLWSLLFLIPGIVKSYSYSMVYYLQQEEGGLSREPNDLITESRRMMDGYKWKLFCLDLGFLGWYLLGVLCLGVGVFFVRPYHEAARANFYLALRAELGCATTAEIPQINETNGENNQNV